MSTLWYVPLAFGVVGIVLTVLGARELYRKVRWRRRCTRADGVIWSLRVERHMPGDTSFFYHVPTFAFRAANKRRYQVESRIARRIGHWKAGDAVQVVYDPAEPEGAEIVGHVFSGIFLTLGLGISMLAVALFSFYLITR